MTVNFDQNEHFVDANTNNASDNDLIQINTNSILIEQQQNRNPNENINLYSSQIRSIVEPDGKMPSENIMMSNEEQENLVNSFNMLVDYEDSNQPNNNTEENASLHAQIEEPHSAQNKQVLNNLSNSLNDNIKSIQSNKKTNELNTIDSDVEFNDSKSSHENLKEQATQNEKEDNIDQIVNNIVNDLVCTIENFIQDEADVVILNSEDEENYQISLNKYEAIGNEPRFNYHENSNHENQQEQIIPSERQEIEELEKLNKEDNNFNTNLNQPIFSSKSTISIEKIIATNPENKNSISKDDCIIIDDKVEEQQNGNNRDEVMINNVDKALLNKNKLIMTPLTAASSTISTNTAKNFSTNKTDNRNSIIKKATIQKTIVVTTVCIYEEYYDPLKKKVVKLQLDKASQKSIISENRNFQILENYEKASSIPYVNRNDQHRPSISSSVDSSDSFYSVASKELLSDKDATASTNKKSSHNENHEIFLHIKQEEQEPIILYNNRSPNLNDEANKDLEASSSNRLPTDILTNNNKKKHHFAFKKTSNRRNFLSNRYDNKEESLNDNYVSINVIQNDNKKILLRNREINKQHTAKKTAKTSKTRRNNRVNSTASNCSNTSNKIKPIGVSQRVDFNSMKIDLTPKIISATSTTAYGINQQQKEQNHNNETLLNENHDHENPDQLNSTAQLGRKICINTNSENELEYQTNLEDDQQHKNSNVYSDIINNDLLLSTGTNKNDSLNQRQQSPSSANLNKSWTLTSSQLQSFAQPNQASSSQTLSTSNVQYNGFDDFLRDFGNSMENNNTSTNNEGVFMGDPYANNFAVQNEVVIEYMEDNNNQNHDLNFNFEVQNSFKQSRNLEEELFEKFKLQKCSIKLKDISMKYKNLIHEQKVDLKSKTTKISRGSKTNTPITKSSPQSSNNKKASVKKRLESENVRKSPRIIKSLPKKNEQNSIVLSDNEMKTPELKKKSSKSSPKNKSVDLLIRFSQDQTVFAKNLSDNNFYPARITKVTNGYSRNNVVNETFYNVKFISSDCEENTLTSDQLVPIDILDKNDKIMYLSKNNYNEKAKEYSTGTFLSYSFQHDEKLDKSESMFVVTCKKTSRNLTLKLSQLAIPKRSAETMIKRHRDHVIEDNKYQVNQNVEEKNVSGSEYEPIIHKLRRDKNAKQQLNYVSMEDDQDGKEHNHKSKRRKIDENDDDNHSNSSRRSSLSLTTSKAVGFINQTKPKNSHNNSITSISNLKISLY